jgi:NADH:ubiquinone oxidoreductase subunit 3 (subunit A)
MTETIALLLIWTVFCGFLALCLVVERLLTRKKPNPWVSYNSRWPKTKGFLK